MFLEYALGIVHSLRAFVIVTCTYALASDVEGVRALAQLSIHCSVEFAFFAGGSMSVSTVGTTDR